MSRQPLWSKSSHAFAFPRPTLHPPINPPDSPSCSCFPRNRNLSGEVQLAHWPHRAAEEPTRLESELAQLAADGRASNPEPHFSRRLLNWSNLTTSPAHPRVLNWLQTLPDFEPDCENLKPTEGLQQLLSPDTPRTPPLHSAEGVSGPYCVCAKGGKLVGRRKRDKLRQRVQMLIDKIKNIGKRTA